MYFADDDPVVARVSRVIDRSIVGLAGVIKAADNF